MWKRFKKNNSIENRKRGTHIQAQNTEYQNSWHIHKSHVQKKNVDQKPIDTHQFMKWNIQSY